jgi:hypothetical protein
MVLIQSPYRAARCCERELIMPRKALAPELIPHLKDILRDVLAVKNDVSGMHRIVLERAADDLVTVLDLCHARIAPITTSTERTTSVDGEQDAAAATPEPAAAAAPRKRVSRSRKAAA